MIESFYYNEAEIELPERQIHVEWQLGAYLKKNLFVISTWCYCFISKYYVYDVCNACAPGSRSSFNDMWCVLLRSTCDL
jgi:hypothetical protein